MMRTSDRGVVSLAARSVLGSGATSPFTARVTPPELRIRTSFFARFDDAIVAREGKRSKAIEELLGRSKRDS